MEITRMENQMEKKMENEMETREYIGVIGQGRCTQATHVMTCSARRLSSPAAACFPQKGTFSSPLGVTPVRANTPPHHKMEPCWKYLLLDTGVVFKGTGIAFIALATEPAHATAGMTDLGFSAT